MVPLSGSLFLRDLHRRALADGRLHMVETTVVAALAGGLSSIRIDEWGQLSFGTWAQGFTTALLAIGIWLVLGGAVYYFTREAFRSYSATLLVETGLLYLVLEHDSHEALAPLKRREIWARLKLAGGELSFRGRLLVFLRTYAACAGSLGFHAYPALMRWLSRAVDYASLLLAALFAWLVYRNILNAYLFELQFPLSVKLVAGLLLLLILARATLGIARRTGLWLAVTDVLLGEVEPGQAVLTRG